VLLYRVGNWVTQQRALSRVTSGWPVTRPDSDNGPLSSPISRRAPLDATLAEITSL
jgi:hypothetical protein